MKFCQELMNNITTFLKDTHDLDASPAPALHALSILSKKLTLPTKHGILFLVTLFARCRS